jgi:hypothetical protein
MQAVARPPSLPRPAVDFEEYTARLRYVCQTCPYAYAIKQRVGRCSACSLAQERAAGGASGGQAAPNTCLV